MYKAPSTVLVRGKHSVSIYYYLDHRSPLRDQCQIQLADLFYLAYKMSIILTPECL